MLSIARNKLLSTALEKPGRITDYLHFHYVCYYYSLPLLVVVVGFASC